MHRTRLTERVVRESKAATRELVLWDAGADGLALRVRVSGSKSWLLDYRTRDGRRRRMTLGTWPAWTLERARAESIRQTSAVLSGGDPLEARRDARDGATFADLAGRYIERHARPRKRTWRDDERVLARELLPRWGQRKAVEVSRRDVAALHADLGVRGTYAANRVLGLVSSIFGWGERSGELPEDHRNPARRVARFRETPRDRWLSGDEVRRLMEAVEHEANVYTRAFFWLSLLLGTRRSETLAIRWADVDLDAATLGLPVTKSGRPHRLPLAPRVLDLLRALPREAGNPYVLPGRAPGSHLAAPTVEVAWRRCRAAAGAPDARLHDLRRTVGSWLVQHGATLALTGAVLNHRTPQTTMIYARFGADSAREPLAAHAERLVAAVGFTPMLTPGRLPAWDAVYGEDD